MARRNKAQPIKDATVLSEHLKAGKSIKGLIGFIAINKEDEDGDPVYIKIQCLGLKTPGTEDEFSCDSSLKVLGEVIGTGSLIAFNVCDWLDSIKDVEAFSAKNRAKSQARLDFQSITQHHFVARKRIALMAYIEDKLNSTDKTALKEDIKEKKLSLNTLGESEVKEYAAAAVKLANNLNPDDVDARYW